MTFGWSYPPGVTGNEYAISGAEFEDHRDEPCPKCGEKALVLQGHHDLGLWVFCVECDWEYDFGHIDSPDVVIPKAIE